MTWYMTHLMGDTVNHLMSDSVIDLIPDSLIDLVFDSVSDSIVTQCWKYVDHYIIIRPSILSLYQSEIHRNWYNNAHF